MNLLRRLRSSGFERLSRKRHLVALDLSLTDPEFRLWSLLVSLYNWFEEYQETYGKVVATNRGVAQLLPKSEWSASKVNRTIKSLIQKDLITQSGRSEYKINVSVVQQNIAPVKHKDSPVKQFVSPVKQEWPQKEDSPFNSSKEVSSFRGDEESPGLSIDDTRWIDSNV